MVPPPIPTGIDAPKRRSIKYNLTRGDIFRWHLYVLLRNRVLLAVLVVGNLFVIWHDLRAPELAAYSAGFKIFYGVFHSLVMLGIFSVLMLVLVAVMVMSRKLRGLVGEHELEICDEGLWERTDVNESLSRWGGFHKIVTTRKHLYIYVTDSNHHMVPRSCFPSGQEEQAFRDELERHIKLAQPGR